MASAFEAYDFIFRGIPSERYGLKIGYVDSSVKDTNLGSNVSIVEDKVRRNPVPYFYGTEITPPLSFDMFIFSEEDLDAFDRQAIGQWLFGRQNYEFLQIEQADMESIFYNAILMNPQNWNVGNRKFAIRFTVRCDSPFAWTDEITQTFTINGVTNITYRNYSDSHEYYYPQIVYTNTTGNSISIVNNSDNGREFNVSALSPGEVLTIDNNLQIFETSVGENRLNDFNFKWLRFNTGYNSLVATGNGTLQITARFPKKVGA